jgi:hypothetical protein
VKTPWLSAIAIAASTREQRRMAAFRTVRQNQHIIAFDAQEGHLREA